MLPSLTSLRTNIWSGDGVTWESVDWGDTNEGSYGRVIRKGDKEQCIQGYVW